MLDNKKEMAIVNIGPTRADTLTHLKVEGICGEVLPQVVYKLCGDTNPTIEMQSLISNFGTIKNNN